MAITPLPTVSFNFSKYRALNTSRRYSWSAFRSLRLQLLLQFTSWKNVQEPRKTAIYRSRMAALLHICLHIVPVVAGMVLVVLNINSKIISDSMSTNVFTALQFASKFLEILIQASIATMVMAYVRNEVLGSRTLPFGGLIAPFRTTEISSLWSLELWGCFTSTSLDRRRRLMLCSCLPISVVLTALVGPSSAVLMIPRWMRQPDFTCLYLLNQRDALFPTSVSLTNNTLQ